MRVEPLTGLLVDFCRERDAGYVVKGLRFASDFDFELQMAHINHRLTGLETVLLPASAQWGTLSSTMVREVASLGGDVSQTVVVGDTGYDMLMARAAGAFALGVTWGYNGRDELTEAGAQVLADGFADVPALARGLLVERI